MKTRKSTWLAALLFLVFCVALGVRHFSSPYQRTLNLYRNQRTSLATIVERIRQDPSVISKVVSVSLDTSKNPELLYWQKIEAVRHKSGDVSVWFHHETTGMLSTRIVGVAYFPELPVDDAGAEKYTPIEGNWYVFDFYMRQ